MTFGSDRDGKKPKAWKEIWGSGQGIGMISESVSARELIARLAAEYRQAQAGLGQAA